MSDEVLAAELREVLAENAALARMINESRPQLAAARAVTQAWRALGFEDRCMACIEYPELADALDAFTATEPAEGDTALAAVWRREKHLNPPDRESYEETIAILSDPDAMEAIREGQDGMSDEFRSGPPAPAAPDAALAVLAELVALNDGPISTANVGQWHELWARARALVDGQGEVGT